MQGRSAHTGEQTLLGETLQTTVFIPVAGRQSWRCRDSHTVALIQPFFLSLFLFFLFCSLSPSNDGEFHFTAH